MTTPAIAVHGLSKTFAGQKALDGVDMTVAPGEIRALVGQNGSGKSTLIKLLAGFHQADPGGRVDVAGDHLALGDAEAAEVAGLRFVHQDLGLVPTLDTVDNLALGHGYDVGSTGTIRWRAEERAAQEALDRLGYSFDVRRPVSQLAMSERTAIAIARALAPRRAPTRLLVLDEPTANLPAAEVNRLYELVRTVSNSGVAVLFVSHHLEEVFELAESVTVLRDGKHIVTRPLGGLTEPALVELLVGRALEEHHAQHAPDEVTEVALSLRGLGGDVVRHLDLDVREREVVGIAGITGSGREEVAGLVFGGADHRGDVIVRGRAVPAGRPDLSIDAGLALVPAERHANAAFMSATLSENLTVVDPHRHLLRGFIRPSREREDVRSWLGRLGVQPAWPDFTMESLSGGNQQKLVLARWLRQEPAVLLLDEPTQGVDVGAKVDIYSRITAAAREGTAVLVMSTDHEELVTLCDRVIVLRGGRVAEELRGAQLTADHLTASVIGQGRAA